MATGMRRHYGIPEAIGELVPGAQWVCRENDYNQIEWFSTDVEKPTLEVIQEKIAELEADEPIRVVREIRDWYLSNCDWTQATDLQAIRGAEWCAAWATYRQTLRDLPASGITPSFGEMDMLQGVAWPVAPELN
jgi:hypothetical protein